jgi:hypothetical protein
MLPEGEPNGKIGRTPGFRAALEKRDVLAITALRATYESAIMTRQS